MTNLLILSPRYTPDSINLRRAALASDWQIERLQNYRVSSNYTSANIALYGEALFTTIIAEQIEHILLEAPADWLGKLPYDYLKRDLLLSTLKDARKIDVPMFIKPAEGKSFQAQVYQTIDNLPSFEAQSDQMPVYISEPVQWDIEFWCFVLERKMAAVSVYSRGGNITENKNGEWIASDQEIGSASKFIQSLLNDSDIQMPPAFVLDVGIIKNRGWAVVEANPAWASSIYGCDPRAILSVLQRSCITTNNLTEKDSQWQINRYHED